VQEFCGFAVAENLDETDFTKLALEDSTDESLHCLLSANRKFHQAGSKVFQVFRAEPFHMKYCKFAFVAVLSLQVMRLEGEIEVYDQSTKNYQLQRHIPLAI
jgi:hypothetical protein